MPTKPMPNTTRMEGRLKALPSLPVDVGGDEDLFERKGSPEGEAVDGHPTSSSQLAGIPLMKPPALDLPRPSKAEVQQQQSPIRRPFRDLYPASPQPQPGYQFHQSSVSLALPPRAGFAGGREGGTSARSETGLCRAPAEPSRLGSALGGSLRGSPEVEATLEAGTDPLLETGTGHKRKTKGRLNLAGGLPLSRLFRSSSVDLLDDLRMQVEVGREDGTDGEENVPQADIVHEQDRAKEHGKGAKGSWLPFTKPKPKRHSPYPGRPTGPHSNPHTRAGSESSSKPLGLGMGSGSRLGSAGRPKGKRSVTTDALPTGRTQGLNGEDRSQGRGDVPAEDGKGEEEVVLIGLGPGVKRKGSIKNMLDRFAGSEAEEEVVTAGMGLKRKGSIKNMLDKFTSRNQPGREQEDREDGIGWEMMRTNRLEADAGRSSGSVGESVSASGSGSGSARPSAEERKWSEEGYSAKEIVPRDLSPLHTSSNGLGRSARKAREKTQPGCLSVPGIERGGGKVKRKSSWRRAGKKEVKEVDDGIGTPMLVQHDLHVTASFKGLPPAWIEQLRQQGIGHKEMEMIMSGRRQKDSISSLEGVSPKAGGKPGSPLRGVGLPEIMPDRSPFSADKTIRGLTLSGHLATTPLRPAPRFVRPTDNLLDIDKTLPDTPPRFATPMGTLIDRDLLRSSVEERPAKHFRTSSENLLGSIVNGIQQGHKKSVSYLHQLQPGYGNDARTSAEDVVDPKRPLRCRRRAGTEDSPLLLHVPKDGPASSDPAGYPAFTPVKSLSAEIKKFSTIKLSFETDRPEGPGADDWVGEVLMTLDKGFDGSQQSRPSMESAIQVPRSISVDAPTPMYYQNLRPLDISDFRHDPDASTGMTSGLTADSGSTEVLQSPGEEEDALRIGMVSPVSDPQYAFLQDRDYLGDRAGCDIGMSVPRTPTPPGKEPRAKKMSVSPPRRKSSLNRGGFSFGRGASEGLYVRGRPSEDGPPSLLYRTISLSPSTEIVTLPEHDNFVTPTTSDEPGHHADTARYSEAMSWDGPLSTNEDHSYSIGTVHTAWRAKPLTFDVLGQPEGANSRQLSSAENRG